MPQFKAEFIFPMVLTFIAAVVLNGVMLAYYYGMMVQRVTVLEKHQELQRQEWKEARERAEKIIERLEAAIRSGK